MATYKINHLYAVWFVGPNEFDLPEDLIKKTIKLTGLTDWERAQGFDALMLYDDIVEHCNGVHEKLKKFK